MGHPTPPNCARCGAPFDLVRFGAARKYCKSCSAAVAREQDRDRQRRKRGDGKRQPIDCIMCGTRFQPNPLGAIPKACPDCRQQFYNQRPPRPPVDREVRRNRTMLRSYGITLQERDEMLAKQGGVCLICGTPETAQRRLQVDHDHDCCSGNETCGRCIRGLICQQCNRAMGLLNDDAGTIAAVVKYLRAGGAPGTPNRARRSRANRNG